MCFMSEVNKAGRNSAKRAKYVQKMVQCVQDQGSGGTQDLTVQE